MKNFVNAVAEFFKLETAVGIPLVGAAAFASLVAGCSVDSAFLYYPRPYGPGDEEAIAARHPGAQAFVLMRPDGVRLHGWLTGHLDGGGNRPLTLYFGGNAEETSWLLDNARRFPGRAFLFMNYRGYGGSGGAPHENVLLDDALAVYDEAVKRAGIDTARVSVWGRSLGTGIAIHVATERPVSAAVLVSPYDSMDALARRHMPMLSALLSQRYDSIGRAPGARAPALMLAGGRDTLIPPEHSARLRAAWGGPARLVTLPEADHNSISSDAEYWHEIMQFLGSR